MDQTIAGITARYLNARMGHFTGFLANNGCGDEAPDYASIITAALARIEQGTGTFDSEVDAMQLTDYLVENSTWNGLVVATANDLRIWAPDAMDRLNLFLEELDNFKVEGEDELPSGDGFLFLSEDNVPTARTYPPPALFGEDLDD